MPALFTIYPEKRAKIANFSQLPIFVFLIGTGLNTHSYDQIFRKLTHEADIIVYCLETDPFSQTKTLDGFLTKLDDIPTHIQAFYEIPKTSNRYYLGGHDIGGTIALNSVYPWNFHTKMHSLTLHNISLPISGFICFDPVDGDKAEHPNYSLRTKYDANSNAVYVTSHGEVNPYPVLIFATNIVNIGIFPQYDGTHMFRAICKEPVSHSSTHHFLKNKYCFVSDHIFQHYDYIDPDSETYAKMMEDSKHHEDGVSETKKQQIEGFHNFIVAKIISFIFDDVMDESGYEDLHIYYPPAPDRK